MSDADARKRYIRIRYWLFFANPVFVSSVLAALYLTGISFQIDVIARSFAGSSPFISGLLYYLLFSTVLSVVTLPLAFYGTFVLEHQFGFSRQSFGRWAVHIAKKSLLVFVISGPFVAMLFLTASRYPAWWWVIASSASIVFSLIFTMVFPQIIFPLFYRMRPIDEGVLKEAVSDVAGAMGMPCRDIVLFDLGKDTSKANAALMGWGRSQKIVLADTLVSKFTVNEIKVVVAHEIAHHRCRHIQKSIALSAGLVTACFFITHLFTSTAGIVTDGGAVVRSAFPIALLVFMAAQYLTMPIANVASRSMERQADGVALAATGDKASFISLMRRLSETNFSDDEPHPVLRFLLFDHPPISERIRFAKGFSSQTNPSSASFCAG